MGERRRQVLDTVHQAAEPMGVAEIADRLGIHPNTARFHLEALVSDGVLERTADAPCGPGRPRVGYRARPGLARGAVRRYRLLAEILLGQLSTTPDAPAAATDAGRAWGAHLVARPAPFHQVSAEEAVDRLTVMLDDLDFAPEPVVVDERRPPERVRLRHCPFLELAEPHRDLVCSLHLGLMQGALAELGVAVAVTSLEPFAEPTACLVRLTHAEPGRAGAAAAGIGGEPEGRSARTVPNPVT